MPELPEVETVRRGLQPAMEGATILRAEARRPDLRFPLQPDFLARLDGQVVTSLGRRAKYLLADLASGDVLLMHLGMSGSFRVVSDEAATAPGAFHHPRSDDRAHDHVVFHMSSGASVVCPCAPFTAGPLIWRPPTDDTRFGNFSSVHIRIWSIQ